MSLRTEVDTLFSRSGDGKVHSRVELNDCIECVEAIIAQNARQIADWVADDRIGSGAVVAKFREARDLREVYLAELAAFEAKEVRDRAAVDALGLTSGMRIRIWNTLRRRDLEGVITYLGGPLGWAHLRLDDGSTEMVYLLHDSHPVTVLGFARAAGIANGERSH